MQSRGGDVISGGEPSPEETLEGVPWTLHELLSAAEQAVTAGRTESELEYYRIARDAFPDGWVAYARAGDRLIQLGRLTEAERILEVGLQHADDVVWIARAYYQAALARDDVAAAHARLTDMMERCPGVPFVRADLVSLILDRLGDSAGAERVAAEALRHFPDDAGVWDGYARAAERLERFDDAADRWTALISKHPDHRRAWIGRIRSLLAAGRLAEAEDAADAAEKHFGPDEEIFEQIALATETCGDWHTATAYWNRLVETCGSSRIREERRALAAARAGLHDVADAALDAIVEQWPDEVPPAIWREWAQSAERRGELDLAEQRWRQLVERDPARSEAVLALRDLLRRIGRFEEAEEVLLALAPRSDSAVKYDAIDVLLTRDDGASALALALTVPSYERYQHLRHINQLCRIASCPISEGQLQVVTELLLDEPFNTEAPSIWVPGIVSLLIQLSNEDTDPPERALTAIERLRAKDPADRGSRAPLLAAVSLLTRRYFLPEEDCVARLRDLITQGFSALCFSLAFNRYPGARPWGAHEQIVRAVMTMINGTAWNEARPGGLSTLLALAYRFDIRSFYKLLHAMRQEPSLAALTSLFAAVPAHDPRKVAPPPLRTTRRRPRIALCIAGQLRGYRYSFASWQKSFLPTANFKIFVHTWERIGRKHLVHAQHQALLPNFSVAYAAACRQVDVRFLAAKYPRLFATNEAITDTQLSSFYGTEHVVVEDDLASEFRGWSNAQKQYYKISRAHELVRAANTDFDLEIRLRPDKVIHKVTDDDWHELAAQSTRQRAVFADDGSYFHGGSQLFVGDQFAIGTPPLMDIYASAFERQKSLNAAGAPLVPLGYAAHTTLAATLFFSGVEAKLCSNLVFGQLQDPEVELTPSETLSLLEQDIRERLPEPFDGQFSEALREDATARATR